MKHPANAIYDFIPATGAPVTAADFSREVVSVDNCKACHRQLGGIPGLSEAEDAAGFHGGSRNETHYCVVCHTDQRRYGQKEATFTSNGAIKTFTSETRLVDGRTIGNFPNYIHKIHMGPLLVHAEATTTPASSPSTPRIRRTSATARRATTRSSKSARSTKTKDGDNWKTKPSTLACGACHDGINFATGAGITLHDKAAGLTQSNVNGTGLAHAGGAAARTTVVRALPQLERHRRRPPAGDAAESGQRIGRVARATRTRTRPGSPRARRSGGSRPARSCRRTKCRASRAMRASSR